MLTCTAALSGPISQPRQTRKRDFGVVLGSWHMCKSLASHVCYCWPCASLWLRNVAASTKRGPLDEPIEPPRRRSRRRQDRTTTASAFRGGSLDHPPRFAILAPCWTSRAPMSVRPRPGNRCMCSPAQPSPASPASPAQWRAESALRRRGGAPPLAWLADWSGGAPACSICEKGPPLGESPSSCPGCHFQSLDHLDVPCRARNGSVFPNIENTAVCT